MHVKALDAQMRTLRVRRAVLHTVAHRGSTTDAGPPAVPAFA